LVLCALQLNAQDESLKAAIQNQFLVLKNLSYETQARLEYDYSNRSSVTNTKKGIVQINIPELKEMIGGVGSSYQQEVIRLVVAHELGHQIQYRHQNNTQGGLLYETQADILAGFLMYQMMWNDMLEWQRQMGVTSTKDKRYTDKIKEITDYVYASLNAIFSKGSGESIGRTHPTNEERRMALRDGLTYGNLWLFAEVLPNFTATGEDALSAEDKREAAEHYKQLLHYLPNDNVVTWSKRHAEKIIHSFLANSRYIGVYTDFRWDTRSNNPYVYYYHKIRNLGERTLTLSFYDQVYTVKRTDAENTLFWDLRGTKAYSITLHAGETYEIKDSLKWLALKDYMPRFIHLGETGALYSCTALSDPEESIGFSGNHFAEFARETEPEKDEGVLDVLLSSRQNFDTLIGNVGVFSTEKMRGILSYQSRVDLPSAYETKVVTDETLNGFDLSANYYDGDNRTAAEQRLSMLQSVFTHLDYAVTPGRQQTVSDTRSFMITDRNRKEIGGIDLFHFSNGEYSLALSIFGGE
jgi:hypothetical protein